MKGKRASRLLVALFAITFALGLAPPAAFAAPGSDLTGASPQGGMTAQDDDGNEEGFAIEYQGLEWRGDDNYGEWWLDPEDGFGYEVTYDGEAIGSPQYQTAMYREEWDEDSGECVYALADEAPERGSYSIFVFQRADEGYQGDEDAPEGVEVPEGCYIAWSFYIYIESPYSIEDEDYATLDEFEDTYVYTGSPIRLDYEFWFGYGDDDEENYDLSYYRRVDGEYVEAEASELVDVGNYQAVFTGKGYYTGTLIRDFSIVNANDLALANVYINGDRVDDYDDEVIAVAEGEPIDIELDMPLASENGSREWVQVNEDAYDTVFAYSDDEEADPLESAPTEPGNYMATMTAKEGSGFIGSTSVYFVITSVKDLDYAHLVFDDDFDNESTYSTFSLSEAKNVSIDIVASNMIVPSKYYTLMRIVDEGEGEEGTMESFTGFTAAGEYNLVVFPSAAGKEEGYTGSNTFWIDVLADNNIRLWDVDLNDDDAIFEGSSMPTVKLYRYDDAGDEITLDNKYYSEKYEVYKEEKDEDGDSFWSYEEVDRTEKVVKDTEYRVTVTGKNGYSGTIVDSFDGVSMHDLDYATIACSSGNRTIAQGQPLPTFTVSIGSKTLVAGTDYKLVYYYEGDYDNPLSAPLTKPGEYQVGLVGLGDYENGDDCDEEWFTIVAANSFALASGSVTVGPVKATIKNGYAYAYTNYSSVTQPFSVNLTMNGNPVPSSSYTQLITYSESYWNSNEPLDQNVSEIREAGYYNVKLIAKEESNYTGEVWVQVYVSHKLGESTVSLKTDSCSFTGKAIDPGIVVTVDNVVLDKGFDVKYSSNVKPGIGIAKVNFYGMYSGEVVKTFVIVDPDNPANAADVDVASKVAKMIAELPANVTTSADQAKVTETQTAYNKLSNAQRALIGKSLVTSLRTSVAQATSYEKKHNQNKPTAKKANPLTAKGKTVKAKAKKLKKKAQKIAANKAIGVSGAQGNVTYKLMKVSAKKKLLKQAKKKIKMTSNGQITLKKKLKKGTYKLTVQVAAAGNSNYNAATKTVTVTVKVK